MTKNKRFIITVALLSIIAFPANAFWGSTAPNSDKSTSISLENLLKESERQTGLPAITNFTEKRALKWLYELRDEPNYRTYTYIVNLNGDFVKICDSVGYGINASIQYSNPEKIVVGGASSYGDATYGTLPQAEPNGLFMPEGLAATYVMCVGPEGTDDVKAVYIEPEIIVSPFPLGE